MPAHNQSDREATALSILEQATSRIGILLLNDVTHEECTPTSALDDLRTLDNAEFQRLTRHA